MQERNIAAEKSRMERSNAENGEPRTDKGRPVGRSAECGVPPRSQSNKNGVQHSQKARELEEGRGSAQTKVRASSDLRGNRFRKWGIKGNGQDPRRGAKLLGGDQERKQRGENSAFLGCCSRKSLAEVEREKAIGGGLRADQPVSVTN